MESTVQVSDLIRKLESIKSNETNGDELAVKKKANSVTPPVMASATVPVTQSISVSNSVFTPAKPSTGSQGVTVSIEQVESKWGAILSKVKLEKIRVGAILENAFPAEIVQDVLHVGFTHNDFTGFHIEIIHKEKEYLSNVMKEFLGQRLRIQCDLNRILSVERDHRIPLMSEVEDDHYPAVESVNDEEIKPENGTSQKERVELFRHIRELEQKDPLKRMIEIFDCELIEASYKTNT
jgi:hypothetical protein